MDAAQFKQLKVGDHVKIMYHHEESHLEKIRICATLVGEVRGLDNRGRTSAEVSIEGVGTWWFNARTLALVPTFTPERDKSMWADKLEKGDTFRLLRAGGLNWNEAAMYSLVGTVMVVRENYRGDDKNICAEAVNSPVFSWYIDPHDIEVLTCAARDRYQALHPDAAITAYCSDRNPYGAFPVPQPKEPSTMAIRITKKTFINGIDITTMSDDSLFDRIQEAELEIKRLNEIEHKPTALVTRIENLETGIIELVALLDARTPNPASVE